MRDILRLGIILAVFALVAGVALAFVNIKTMPRIIENKLRAEKEARAEVLPGMAGGYEERGKGSGFTYWIGFPDTAKSETGGYVFTTDGRGYSSTILTMVGVDVDGAITGVKILEQQETPGLGAKIEEVRHGEKDPWFTRQFKGKTVSDTITVTKDGGDIDAITGATISSRTVTNAINRGIAELMEKTRRER